MNSFRRNCLLLTEGLVSDCKTNNCLSGFSAPLSFAAMALDQMKCYNFTQPHRNLLCELCAALVKFDGNWAGALGFSVCG